jgi:hypothetical protein
MPAMSFTRPGSPSLLALAILLAAMAQAPSRAAEPSSPESIAAWCERACREPVKPVMTREVPIQKTVGGRLVTVDTRTEQTPEGKRYLEDHGLWTRLSGGPSDGGCLSRCACAVRRLPRGGLTLADAARNVPAVVGPEWQGCLCRVAPRCAEDGACTFRANQCVAVEAVDCEASRGCKEGRRCTLRDGTCIATAIDIKTPTKGVVDSIEGGAGPVREMRKIVDLKAAREREAQMEQDEKDRRVQLRLKDEATRLDRDPAIVPALKAEAWRKLAAVRQVPPADWAADATRCAEVWDQAAALGPGMQQDWDVIAALLPLELVPRAEKDDIVLKFLRNYEFMDPHPSLLKARATLMTLRQAEAWVCEDKAGVVNITERQLRGQICTRIPESSAEARARRERSALPIPSAAVGQGAGPLNCGPGPIPKRMELNVDLVRMQEQDRLKRLVARAEALDRDAQAEPARKAEAWDAVAALPMQGGNPHAEAARAAATSWRELAALTGRMKADWEEQVLPAMGLKSLSEWDKRAVLEAFLEAYGKLSAEPTVAAAETLREALGEGEATFGRTLAGIETERARQEEARRQELARQEALKRREAERAEDRVKAGRLRTAGWIAAGVTGAALATAAGFGIFAQGTYKGLAETCRADGACGRSQQAEVSRLGSLRTASYVTLGVAGATAATSVILHLLGARLDPDDDPATDGRVEVGVGPGGLSLRGGF